MATCKFCGKTGIFHTVTKNGMCPNCEVFVDNDLRNRTRIFTESKDIINKSENPDVVISRLDVVKDCLTHIIMYEQKGIGFFQPSPSQMLIDIENDRDNIISDCFERSYKTLKIKLLNLKSSSAISNNISKFVQKIDETLPLLQNKNKLIEIRNSCISFTPLLQKNNEPSLVIYPEIEIIEPQETKPNSIQIKEIHPAKLIYIEKKAPQDFGLMGGIRISINMTGENQVEIIGPNEPSTIYKDLLVHAPKKQQVVERPPYFPSYVQLSPEQRWVYLEWLKDISNPIDIGYVFIYYYGLERNLLLGDFETAYREILLLRQYHDSKSFESYSYNALLFAAAFRNKPEVIKILLRDESRNGIANEDLIFKYKFNLGIDPEEMMSLAKKLKGTNLRYIKLRPNLYKAALSKALTEKFDQPEYPLSEKFNIIEIPQTQSITFANISFPTNLRTPKLPNFLKYELFITDCILLFDRANKLVKEDLIRGRLIQE